MSDQQDDRLFELFQALQLPPETDASKLAERVTAQVREEREKRAAASSAGAGPAPAQEMQSAFGKGWRWSLVGLALGILLTIVVVASVIFAFRRPIGAWLAGSETPTPEATVALSTLTHTPPPTMILETPTPTWTSISPPDATPGATSTPAVPTDVATQEPPTAIPSLPTQSEALEECAKGMDLQITCLPVAPDLGLVLGQEVACNATAKTPLESLHWMAQYSQYEFLPNSSDGDAELADNAARFSLPFTGEYTVRAAVLLPECSRLLALIQTTPVTVAPGQSAMVTKDDGAKVRAAPDNGADELATIAKDDHLALVSVEESGGNQWKFLPIHWNTEDGQAWLRYYEVDGKLFHAPVPEEPPYYCEDLGPGFVGELPEPREAVIDGEPFLYDGCGRIVGKVVQGDPASPENVTVIAEGDNWAWIRIWDRDLFVKPEALGSQ